jgi:hypothetical protein
MITELTNYAVNNYGLLAGPVVFSVWRKIRRGAQAVANFCYNIRRPGAR